MKHWAGILLCLAPLVSAQERPRSEAYTNEDLARVAARRAETGVLSEPAVDAAAGARLPSRDASRHGESYWRREAEQQHRRTQALRERIRQAEARLAEAKRRPPARRAPLTAPSHEADERRIAALVAQLRDEEERFLDRARREGALPGWLR